MIFGGLYSMITGRSPRWPRIAKRFLRGKCCAACETKEELEAHHVIPFDERADLELDVGNLMPLCRRCHLIIGHLGRWTWVNRHARQDAATIAGRIAAYRMESQDTADFPRQGV